jgi:hypothetical protein
MTRNRWLQISILVLLAPLLGACASRVAAQAEKRTIKIPPPEVIQFAPLPTPRPASTPLPTSPTAQANQAPDLDQVKAEAGDQDIDHCCAGSGNPVDNIDTSLREKYIAAEAGASYPKKAGNPRYYGMHVYVDENGGFAFWLPTGWYQTAMANGHQGVIFSPYPDNVFTGFMAEKYLLPDAVTQADLPALQENFERCIQGLPGVEVESFTYTPTSTLITLEARFTYLDGDVVRKRWVRQVYWNEGLLILIAQGSTVDEFDYWLPMFYNTMVTFEV